MYTTGEKSAGSSWDASLSLTGRNMFNDIIVWATVRACFKLLISFICQTVKVVCVGWVSNSPCWLMKKKIMLWGWDPQKLGCGWYNGSVMIGDVALVEKKKHWGTSSGDLFTLLSHSALYLIDETAYILYFVLYVTGRNMYNVHYHTEHKQQDPVKKSLHDLKYNLKCGTVGISWLEHLLVFVKPVKPHLHVSYTSHHWNLAKYPYRLRWNEG